MDFNTKLKILAQIAREPRAVFGQSKYILILSHMRSRSSLLSHIMGSNDHICGYSERHASYVSKRDLMKMKLKLSYELNCDFNEKYFLDKLLLEHTFVSKQILKQKNVKPIFLIRDPDSTIKSLMGLGLNGGPEWYLDEKAVCNYYCKRLSLIEDYAKSLNGKFFYVDSERLVNDTPILLEELSRWLELESFLTPNYKKFENTGKKGFGDPSEHIMSGKVTSTSSNTKIVLTSATIEKSYQAYYSCNKVLSIHSNRAN